MKNNFRVAILTLFLVASCGVYTQGFEAINVEAASSYAVSNTLAKPSITSICKTGSMAKLSISKVTGATGYNVYRSTSNDKGFVYVGKSKKTTYIDKKLQTSKTYYYKVRAYKVVKGKKVYSQYSSIVTAGKLVTSTSTNQTNNNNDVNKDKVIQNTSNQSAGSQSSANINSSYAAKVLQLVNVERSKGGLKALTTNSALTNAANVRAKEIKISFSHTRPNGSSPFTALKEFNINYNAAGENIAYGQRSPEEVVKGWMNSPGHRANIMNGNFGKVGIGCYVSNGTIYWTQLFTN